MLDQIVTDRKILRQLSMPTNWDEVGRLDLINRIKNSCDTAWARGCGLAAIQIGIPLRFAWFKWGEEEFTLMNPHIVSASGSKVKQEGCLSIPNRWTHVERAYKIKYTNDGKLCTAKGDKAHIIQHEIDHMNGVLNVDKAVKS